MLTEKCFTSSFYIFTFLWTQVSTLDYVIHFDRMENIKGNVENLVNFFEWKVEGRGSNYLINGNFAYATDMDNSFTHEFKTEVRPFQHGGFIPHSFQRDPMCSYYNVTYKKYLEPIIKDHTNFPILPQQGLCPIPLGSYYVKNAIINEEDLPQHMPRGFWKVELKFFKEKQCVGGLRIYAEVKNKD